MFFKGCGSLGSSRRLVLYTEISRRIVPDTICFSANLAGQAALPTRPEWPSCVQQFQTWEQVSTVRLMEGSGGPLGLQLPVGPIGSTPLLLLVGPAFFVILHLYRGTWDMQTDLAEVIRGAIGETVTVFFTTDVGIKAGPAITKPEGQPYEPPQADVTAIIGFSGTMEGGVHLSAPLHAALCLAAAFSGEPLDSLDATTKDAFGELANIVAGAVKDRISETLYLTPPQVVTGKNHEIVYTKALESTKCYFRTSNGPFFVEVFYRK